MRKNYKLPDSYKKPKLIQWKIRPQKKFKCVYCGSVFMNRGSLPICHLCRIPNREIVS